MIRARVVHRIPGRTRLRAEALPEDAAGRAELREALAGLPGVYEVSLREATGSVVLRHRRDFSLEAALAGAQAPVPLEIEATPAESAGEPTPGGAEFTAGEPPAGRGDAGEAAGPGTGGDPQGGATAWREAPRASPGSGPARGDAARPGAEERVRDSGRGAGEGAHPGVEDGRHGNGPGTGAPAGRTTAGNEPGAGAAEAWGALWARLRRELPEDLRRPRDLAATLVLALAAVQIARGQVLGSATSLLWYAYQLRGGAPAAPDDIPEDP